MANNETRVEADGVQVLPDFDAELGFPHNLVAKIRFSLHSGCLFEERGARE